MHRPHKGNDMKNSHDNVDDLYKYINDLPVINCHEHLPAFDSEFETKETDIFCQLDYLMDDLHSAGMTESEKEILLKAENIHTKWHVFKYYYPYIRHTSYGRGFSILLKDFFGVDELNEENINDVNKKYKAIIKQKNLYEEILKKKSNIVISMRNDTDNVCDPRYFHQVYSIDSALGLYQLKDLMEIEKLSGIKIKTFMDYEQALSLFIEKLILEKGYKVFKLAYAYYRNLDFSDVDKEVARKQFEDRCLPKDRFKEYSFDACTDFVNFGFNTMMTVMNQYDVTLQVHTGIFANGSNILEHGNVIKLNSTFIKYQRIKFDIFHISYPYENELIGLCKMFGNVYINFCWAHSISSHASIQALVHCLDVLPINKILGFGGDSKNPLFTYAYLVQAKQNIAQALIICLERGMFDIKQCQWIAKRILFDNPSEIYGLGLDSEQ
jgi:uncharacterized protein